MAAGVGAKPAQVALAWLISLPGVVAIPGASSVEQLEFNVEAADIELKAESIDALTTAAQAFRPVSAVRSIGDTVPGGRGRASPRRPIECVDRGLLPCNSPDGPRAL